MPKEISLTQGQVALVDDFDFEFLNQWKWYAQKDQRTFYARRWAGCAGGKQIVVRMHNLILPSPVGFETDHRDRNGLNNQRHNLRSVRHVSNTVNQRIRRDNKTGFKGVSFRKETGVFRAVISFERRSLSLGQSETAVGAAKLYDAAAKRLYGEFAYLNFPNSETPNPERQNQYA